MKNYDAIETFFTNNLFVPSRTVYMGSIDTNKDGEESGTDYAMADSVIKGLHILDRTPGSIDIIMNNPGGDEFHGYAIYDAIKLCKNHVRIITYGHAMSMGGIILQAADERVMTPNSKFMMHYGTAPVSGTAHNAYRMIDEYKKVDKFMEELFFSKIIEKHPEFTARRIRQMLAVDTYLSAQETVELGLADKILT